MSSQQRELKVKVVTKLESAMRHAKALIFWLLPLVTAVSAQHFPTGPQIFRQSPTRHVPCVCSSSALPHSISGYRNSPCSFPSNLCSHLSFSHVIAHPISTRDFVEICPSVFFSSDAFFGNINRRATDCVRRSISLLPPPDTEAYLVLIAYSCLLACQFGHKVFSASNLF